MTWYCDFGHENPPTFESEAGWREHMLDLEAHPAFRKVSNQAQLDSLSPQKQQVALRDRFVCPLCERIPEEAQQKLETGANDAAQVHNSVVNHVASHLKSLSLMAIPSLGDTANEAANHHEKSIAFSRDSFRRLLNADSLPQPPSSQDNIHDSPLPPSEWSNLKHEIISLNIQQGWDDDFGDYKQPDEPPEPFGYGWLEQWGQWKEDHDAALNQLPENDPILIHIVTMQTQLTATDIDFQDNVGRTALSSTTQIGKLEAIG
ncbi:hypothetical protein IL306_009841 [Fusarium sp. DS 682]|nr:hypothetical protein IL306_009841 [Fusarium sp. DS 682]